MLRVLCHNGQVLHPVCLQWCSVHISRAEVHSNFLQIGYCHCLAEQVFTGTRELMANNLKAWGDRNYGLGWSGGGLLQGATFYRLSYVKSHWNGVTLTLNGVQDATVILCPLAVSAGFLQSLHVFASLCYVFTI